MGQKDYESAKQMNRAGGECLEKGDYEGALERYSKALEFLPEGEPEAKAGLHNNIGHAHVRLKKYDAALSSFRNAAEIFEELGNEIQLGVQLGNIGSVYRDMEKWGAALDSYFKALAAFEEMSHKEGMADQYSNIGYAYTRRGELDSGFEFFEKAKTLYDELGDERKSQLCDQNIQALQSHLEE